MKRFFIKKGGKNLSVSTLEKREVLENKETITERVDVKAKTITNQLNNFIAENIELIGQVIPSNPVISKQDEWRTDDYSKYDAISNKTKPNKTKLRGKKYGRYNDKAVGHMARRFSLRRKP